MNEPIPGDPPRAQHCPSCHDRGTVSVPDIRQIEFGLWTSPYKDPAAANYGRGLQRMSVVCFCEHGTRIRESDQAARETAAKGCRPMPVRMGLSEYELKIPDWQTQILNADAAAARENREDPWPDGRVFDPKNPSHAAYKRLIERAGRDPRDYFTFAQEKKPTQVVPSQFFINDDYDRGDDPDAY